MNPRDHLHNDCTVIDGLVVGKPGRALYEAMHQGGLTAVNFTCSIWEGFTDSMREIAEWKRRFRKHSDILKAIYTTADIEQAKREQRVGVILGWQNSSGFEDYLPYVGLFHELGLRVVQLTYHTANLSGSGCLEGSDGGITDFGRELVAELNAVGILIDLSHVGSKTSADTVLESKQPVAYTHCAPAALRDHPRNKADVEMRLVADRGGVVGVTMFPPFLRHGNESTIDDYLDAIEHVINLVGEEHTAIGTDFTQGREPEDMNIFLHDKGYARRLLEIGDIVMPKGIRGIEDFPNLTAAMERRGWAETRIRKVMGENWLRLFNEVWR
jgi:membrane dipeptidase